MVATSALGAGIDVQGIRLVVHLHMPDGLLDFAQEVGRAGWDGASVRSILTTLS